MRVCHMPVAVAEVGSGWSGVYLGMWSRGGGFEAVTCTLCWGDSLKFCNFRVLVLVLGFQWNTFPRSFIPTVFFDVCSGGVYMSARVWYIPRHHH